jgi:carbon-monoxide dehydrogenase medium subunit
MLDPFTLHQPGSVVEASQLLTHYGPEAALYAGGTELLVVMKERLTHFPHLIDIKRIPGLREIALAPGSRELVVGALATHRDLEYAPLVRKYLPVFATMASTVANVRVRSMGTIGGNLGFAEPHSDPATLLAALDARVTLASATGSRELPVAEFTTGLMQTQRRHDELITLVSIPLLPDNAAAAYERFKLHERPTAAVAAVIAVEDGAITDARVVAGSVGERPQRLPQTEAFLRAQPATISIAEAAAALIRAEVETETDAFESEAYKRQLARTVGQRAIARAIQRVTGEEGDRRAA